MSSRAWIGAAVVGGGLLVWNSLSQRAMVSKVDGLVDRIALLEERSEAPISRRAGRAGAGNARGVLRGEGRRMRRQASRNEDTGSQDVAGAADLTEIPEALRDELVQIVEAEQENASENRREEWRARFEEGMRSSVEEFVEERGVSDEVASQMRTIFEEGMQEASRLHNEMKDEEISWYQFRKEMKANREAWEEDLESVMSDDDFQEILEVFPRRY